MPYQIINVGTGSAVFTADSKAEILTARYEMQGQAPIRPFLKTEWRDGQRRCSANFDELNVSGKDTRRGVVGTAPWYSEALGTIRIPIFGQVLRRFMVVDDTGHKIDIRKWFAEVEAVNGAEVDMFGNVMLPGSQYRKESAQNNGFRKGPCGEGARKTRHRARCAALWKQNLIDADQSVPGDHSRPRKRVDRAEMAGYGDYVMTGGAKSKSWKDQSKTARQWTKKKHRNVKRSSLYSARLLYERVDEFYEELDEDDIA